MWLALLIGIIMRLDGAGNGNDSNAPLGKLASSPDLKHSLAARKAF